MRVTRRGLSKQVRKSEIPHRIPEQDLFRAGSAG
jgi:hypothetical protein